MAAGARAAAATQRDAKRKSADRRRSHRRQGNARQAAPAASGRPLESPRRCRCSKRILLGIVQGLTEFLPISSSGHLILVPWLQDYTYLQDHESFNKTFDVALHIGTLAAVVTYFRSDLARMFAGWFRTLRTRAIETVDERLAWVVVVATIPAVIVGGLGRGLDRRATSASRG